MLSLSTTLTAFLLATSALGAFTPVPNRRVLIDRDTFPEVYARGGGSGSPSHFQPGTCYHFTPHGSYDEKWFNKQKDYSACICIPKGEDKDYCPKGKVVPEFTQLSGLEDCYKPMPKCVLPEGCVPKPSKDKCCDYTCPHGKCGKHCLKKHETCVSGSPVNNAAPIANRRSMGPNVCPRGGVMCPTTSSLNNVRFECVSVQSDVDSCGGCVYADPFDNSSAPTGEDCTQIPNALDVACVKGKCVVEECEDGYEVVPGKGCVFSERQALRLQRYRL